MMQQMNGPNADPPGASLSSHTTNSSIADIVVRNPPSVMPGIGGSGIDVSNIGVLMTSMSLETLGLDMSLEEAVNKVRELAKENSKLREDAQKNNQTMKQQYQTLSDWKRKWENEREDVKKRHDQAKSVVTNLRDQLKKKEQCIMELQLELAQQEEKKFQVSPSAKAELLTMEQAKSELEKRCQDYLQQIQMLAEEVQAGKSEREEHCIEIDKYIKMVCENEQKMKQVERSNQMLIEEMREMNDVKDSRDKLQKENRELCEKINYLNEELEKLRYSSVTSENILETMQSYIQVNIPSGREESDAVPYSDVDPQDSSIQEVQSAATPSYPSTTGQSKLQAGKPFTTSIENVQKKESDVKHTQEKAVSDLLAQMQEERNKVALLQGEIQQKNQEMEALHKKVHKTEEMMAESDYKLNLTSAKMKVEHQKEVEDLRMQLAHVKEELKHTKKHSSSRSSMESQPYYSSTEEDMKNLRVQVTSLVGELQEANDKFESTQVLYEKQKERIQFLEDKVQGQEEQKYIQRARDDELIETMRLTINGLETQLANERATKSKTNEDVEKVKKDYLIVVQHYRELTRQNEGLKKQLEQQKAGALSSDEKTRYEIKIDNLTAQLVTAEESMQGRMKKLQESETEKVKLAQQLDELRAENDLVAVHKAQAEVYKADFDAERRAREESHAEKERIQDEINQMIMRNQQLQEELDNLSQNQIAQMQLRHGAPQNPYNRGGYLAAGYGAYDYPPQRPFDGQNATGPGGRGDNAQVAGQNPQQSANEEEQQFICPKCDEQCPDLDTLQLHVLDCIV